MVGSSRRQEVRITRIIPEVRSRDLAETREFYGGLLGLEVDQAQEDSLLMHSPTHPNAQLVVNDNAHPNLPPGFAIDIDDPRRVARLYEEVQWRGFAIVEPLEDKPGGIRRFSMIDPNGVRVTILSRLEPLG